MIIVVIGIDIASIIMNRVMVHRCELSATGKALYFVICIHRDTPAVVHYRN